MKVEDIGPKISIHSLISLQSAGLMLFNTFMKALGQQKVVHQ